MILFSLLVKDKLNFCFQCNKVIDKIDNLSIEHKIPWLDSKNPVELFFDLENIAFSHLSCNAGAGRSWNKGNKSPHGTFSRYTHYRCRCVDCQRANRNHHRQYRKKKNAT